MNTLPFKSLLISGIAITALAACSQVRNTDVAAPVVTNTTVQTAPVVTQQRFIAPQPAFTAQPITVPRVQVAQAPVTTVQNIRTPVIQQTQVAAAASVPPNPLGQSGPPNPRPGECYARVTVAAVTETFSETVTAEPARQETRVIPARYGEVTETVVVREATEELRVVPAQYRTVTEDVVVRPAARKVLPVEPVFQTVRERVLVKPAQTVWKPGRGPIERIDNSTGEILCLVEEPAVYDFVERRVQVTPATTRSEVIPAVTRQVTKQVVAAPARVEKQVIPAVTREIRKRVIIEPARQEVINIPAVQRAVNRQRVTAPSRTEWRPILCETNTTPGLIRRIQVALRDRGFNPGPLDGVLGVQTKAAVDRFQRSLGLQSTGITIQTLQALNVPQ